MTEKEIQLSLELIRKKIHIVRGQKVMLDRDLAELYEIKSIRLREQVKRNRTRFPEDFMFQLDKAETENMVSQNAIPSHKHLGGHLPYAFTEQGVAMLSSVLKSERAIQVNILIMRTFVKMKELMKIHKDIYQRMNRLEIKQFKHGQSIDKINHVIEEMLKLPVTLKWKPKPIGFRKR